MKPANEIADNVIWADGFEEADHAIRADRREVARFVLEEAARLSWPYDKEPGVEPHNERHVERHQFALELRKLAAAADVEIDEILEPKEAGGK